LRGGTAFCVAVFQFSPGAEEGGRRGGGFTDKDRFEGGNPGEREEIGFESNPATGISGRTAEGPASLECGACRENVMGSGKIKDLSRGKIVGVNDFGEESLVIGSQVFSDGSGYNRSEKDIFLRSEGDGVIDGDVLIFDPKAPGFYGHKFDLRGNASSENGASESFGWEMPPSLPRSDGGFIKRKGRRENRESGLGGFGSESGEITERGAPTGVFGLEGLRGANLIIIFRIEGILKNKNEREDRKGEKKYCSNAPSDPSSPRLRKGSWELFLGFGKDGWSWGRLEGWLNAAGRAGPEHSLRLSVESSARKSGEE